jgi:hypothetical protein
MVHYKLQVYNAWKLIINEKSHMYPKLDIISLTIVVATLERSPSRDFIHEIDDVFMDAVESQIVLPKLSIDITWEIDLSGMGLFLNSILSYEITSHEYDCKCQTLTLSANIFFL